MSGGDKGRSARAFSAQAALRTGVLGLCLPDCLPGGGMSLSGKGLVLAKAGR